MPNSKNSFYFPHDCSARDDQQLLKVRGKFGLEGYAVFWMCLESMSTNDGYIEPDSVPGIAITFGIKEAQLIAQLEFFHEIKLFQKDSRGYHSKRMDKHLNFRKERKESGKKGAESRWGDSSANSSAIAQPMQRKGKERKGKRYTSLNDIGEGDLKEIAEQYSVSLAGVRSLAEDLRLYCESKGKRYANYKSALQNWTRKAIKEHKISKESRPQPELEPDYDQEEARKNLERVRLMRNKIMGGVSV